MTDLSKIPDLELRQKIKPLYEKMAALDKRHDELYDQHTEARSAACQPVSDEIAAIGEQIETLLEAHPEASEIAGLCEATGLPVFDSDETKTRRTLACIG